jgi:hypothetical protein
MASRVWLFVLIEALLLSSVAAGSHGNSSHHSGVAGGGGGVLPWEIRSSEKLPWEGLEDDLDALLRVQVR